MICPNCNKVVPDEANVCGYCGNRLRSSPGFKLAEAPQLASDKKLPGRQATLLSLLISSGICLVVTGSISLVGLRFIPGYWISAGSGNLFLILIKGVFGLFLTVLGLVILVQGFTPLLARRALAKEARDIFPTPIPGGTIFLSLGKLAFGIFCLVVGVGMMTLVFYQEVIPWLGF